MINRPFTSSKRKTTAPGKTPASHDAGAANRQVDSKQPIAGNRFPMLLAAACLVAFVAVGLTGCTGAKTTTPPAYPFTPEAQANYDYLVYQDQIQRLQRHRAEGSRSPLTPEEVFEIAARAEAALNRLLEIAPTPQLYMEKAALFWNDPKGIAKSRSALKEGLAEFPDNQYLTINLANSYIMDGRTQDAVDVMEEYLTAHPDNIRARQRLGQMLLDADMNAEALDALKKIPADKRSADTIYAMGRAQGNLGMRKTAIKNLKKAISMDPNFTEAKVELAYQYELAKDYVAAEKTYASILEQGDPFPEARLRLINLNLKLNNPAKAMDIAMDGPPSKAFIMEAAIMFIENDFYAQGSTVLDRLASSGQIPAEYYFYKAVIANEGENDADKALDYLDKVQESDRLYPHALRFKAQLRSAQGEDEKALTIAHKGKEAFPGAPIFYILESTLLQRVGDNVRAEAVLEEGLAKLKGNPEISYELGMLYEITGRRAKALSLMESILRKHPDHTNALNYVGYTLAEEDRDLDRALVLVQKAASMEPENGFILDSVAWVYFKMGKLAKAWENINYAVDIVEIDPTIWEHYADIARALGKIKEARKGYNYALKYRTSNPGAVRAKLKDL